MRLLLIFILLGLLFASPLLIWGDRFDAALDGGQAVTWLRGLDHLAAPVGVGLIVADLFLPIPATGVMGALGIIHGVVLGGLLSALGSTLAGLVAYGLARALGERAAVFMVGRKDLDRATAFFERGGGFAIAVSRPLPLLPEVIACLAGLAGMKTKRFVIALSCGSVPTGFVYAAIGAAGFERPVLTLLICVFLPILLWPLARKSLLNGSRDVNKN